MNAQELAKAITEYVRDDLGSFFGHGKHTEARSLHATFMMKILAENSGLDTQKQQKIARILTGRINHSDPSVRQRYRGRGSSFGNLLENFAPKLQETKTEIKKEPDSEDLALLKKTLLTYPDQGNNTYRALLDLIHDIIHSDLEEKTIKLALKHLLASYRLLKQPIDSRNPNLLLEKMQGYVREQINEFPRDLYNAVNNFSISDQSAAFVNKKRGITQKCKDIEEDINSLRTAGMITYGLVDKLNADLKQLETDLKPLPSSASTYSSATVNYDQKISASQSTLEFGLDTTAEKIDQRVKFLKKSVAQAQSIEGHFTELNELGKPFIYDDKVRNENLRKVSAELTVIENDLTKSTQEKDLEKTAEKLQGVKQSIAKVKQEDSWVKTVYDSIAVTVSGILTSFRFLISNSNVTKIKSGLVPTKISNYEDPSITIIGVIEFLKTQEIKLDIVSRPNSPGNSPRLSENREIKLDTASQPNSPDNTPKSSENKGLPDTLKNVAALHYFEKNGMFSENPQAKEYKRQAYRLILDGITEIVSLEEKIIANINQGDAKLDSIIEQKRTLEILINNIDKIIKSVEENYSINGKNPAGMIGYIKDFSSFLEESINCLEKHKSKLRSLENDIATLEKMKNQSSKLTIKEFQDIHKSNPDRAEILKQEVAKKDTILGTKYVEALNASETASPKVHEFKRELESKDSPSQASETPPTRKDSDSETIPGTPPSPSSMGEIPESPQKSEISILDTKHLGRTTPPSGLDSPLSTNSNSQTSSISEEGVREPSTSPSSRLSSNSNTLMPQSPKLNPSETPQKKEQKTEEEKPYLTLKQRFDLLSPKDKKIYLEIQKMYADVVKLVYKNQDEIKEDKHLKYDKAQYKGKSKNKEKNEKTALEIEFMFAEVEDTLVELFKCTDIENQFILDPDSISMVSKILEQSKELNPDTIKASDYKAFISQLGESNKLSLPRKVMEKHLSKKLKMGISSGEVKDMTPQALTFSAHYTLKEATPPKQQNHLDEKTPKLIERLKREVDSKDETHTFRTKVVEIIALAINEEFQKNATIEESLKGIFSKISTGIGTDLTIAHQRMFGDKSSQYFLRLFPNLQLKMDGGFELCLKSDTVEPGKFYVSKNGDSLEYSFLDSEKKPVNGVINKKDLNLNIPDPFSIEDVKPHLPEILKYLSNKGIIHDPLVLVPGAANPGINIKLWLEEGLKQSPDFFRPLIENLQKSHHVLPNTETTSEKEIKFSGEINFETIDKLITRTLKDIYQPPFFLKHDLLKFINLIKENVPVAYRSTLDPTSERQKYDTIKIFLDKVLDKAILEKFNTADEISGYVSQIFASKMSSDADFVTFIQRQSESLKTTKFETSPKYKCDHHNEKSLCDFFQLTKEGKVYIQKPPESSLRASSFLQPPKPVKKATMPQQQMQLLAPLPSVEEKKNTVLSKQDQVMQPFGPPIAYATFEDEMHEAATIADNDMGAILGSYIEIKEIVEDQQKKLDKIESNVAEAKHYVELTEIEKAITAGRKIERSDNQRNEFLCQVGSSVYKAGKWVVSNVVKLSVGVAATVGAEIAEGAVKGAVRSTLGS